MSKSNKIIVYDNQHYFARFLKSTFGKDYEFVVLKKNTQSLDLDKIKKEVLFVFFVIYSDADLYDFIRIYKQGVSTMVVASPNSEILQRMRLLEEVLLLDISLTKAKLINIIGSLLDTNSLLNRGQVDELCQL